MKMNKKKRNRFVRYVPVNTPARPFQGHDFRSSVRMLDGSPVLILLTEEVRQRMFYIVDESPEEVSWLGSVVRNNMEFLIDEIFLFVQKVHSAQTRLDEEDVGQFFTELLERPNGVEKSNRIRAWMHSHVTGSTDPSGSYGSGTYGDLAQMHSFGQGAEYFIMGIANKHGELRFDIFFYTLGIKIEDVPWEVVTAEDADMRQRVRQELKEKVSSIPVGQQYFGMHQAFSAENPSGYEVPSLSDEEFRFPELPEGALCHGE